MGMELFPFPRFVKFAVVLLGQCAQGLNTAVMMNTTNMTVSEEGPFSVPLRRESVPIYRQGRVVSHKSSYSALLYVGHSRPQEFRVVFDTGSGHLLLPAEECKSEACLVHRRYDITKSQSAIPVNSDGSEVPVGQFCEQATISFGTGQIIGEFVHENVCVGTVQQHVLCTAMKIVTAIEMTTQPFRSFKFDGILGMGLKSLALNPGFSFFDALVHNKTNLEAHFAVFLTEGENGEDSEITLGGQNGARMLESLSWNPVPHAHLGHWQVEILALRINGVVHDVCRDRLCRGVVDTGTSHLGIPGSHFRSLNDALTLSAGDLLDCRLAKAPQIELELRSNNLTLSARHYMRRLPLRAGVNVDLPGGVQLPSSSNDTRVSEPPMPVHSNLNENATNVTRFCRPKLMPVNLPPPLGPKLFILGEPVLHRYYTVFDWNHPRIGFALANNRANSQWLNNAQFQGDLPEGVDKLLLQHHVNLH